MRTGDLAMFEILFYEDKSGYSELFEELQQLDGKAKKNKNSRILYNQIVFCIELLSQYGTRIPSNVTKHIQGNIWELRPGKNRILYFYFSDNKYVFLHMFVKKTQKTPKKEIEKAIKEMNDFLERQKGDQNENLGRL